MGILNKLLDVGGKIMEGGGALTSAIGGGMKNKGETVGKQGFEATPKEMRDAWLKTWLPEVLAQNQKERTPWPMKRATDPATDPFAPRGLWEFQQYNDDLKRQTGRGFFDPVTISTPTASSDTASNTDVLRSEMLGRMALQALGGTGGVRGKRPPVSTSADYALFNDIRQPGADVENLLKAINPSDLSAEYRRFFNFGAS